MLLEHLVLLGVGEAGVERQHLGVAQVELAQGVGGVADLPLAVHEDEDVPQPFARQLLDRIEDALQFVAIPLTLQQRAIAHLHRVGATGHLYHRRLVEVIGEALGIYGGRGDDHLEIRPPRQQLLEVAQDEVDVEAALVGLIDDDGVVLGQHAVVLDLRQQDTVSHQLDMGLLAHLIGKAHLVAHVLAEL
ncbi:hypothetical protein D3C84_807740 [compost metagenome]